MPCPNRLLSAFCQKAPALCRGFSTTLQFAGKQQCSRSGEARVRTGDTMIFSPRMSVLVCPISSKNSP